MNPASIVERGSVNIPHPIDILAKFAADSIRVALIEDESVYLPVAPKVAFVYLLSLVAIHYVHCQAFMKHHISIDPLS